ncbi:MAG: hypothetical protein FJY76_01690 [Candidatus Aenigmarchaeota archaeon]|nr:hypothetical protein [Candidatus Aenigmarchaeota archaeon]
MNTTLAVVVSAIVILIAALVVITIFSGGITQVATLAQAKTICSTQYITMCQSTGQKPTTWDINNMNVAGDIKSCAEAAPSCTCSTTQPYVGSCP